MNGGAMRGAGAGARGGGAVSGGAVTAGAAVLVAALTAAAFAVLGATGGFTIGAVLYLLFAVAGLATPAVIPFQVAVGQFAAAGLLLGPARGSPLLVGLLVVGVIVTAELLAMSTRLAPPVAPRRNGDLRRAGGAAAIGAAAFGVVFVLGALPGPGGLLAVMMAAAACVVLAVQLAGEAR
jgi:hypothetical protein